MRSLCLFIFCLSLASMHAQKKVLLEKFTNSHCGVCPNAAIIIQDIVANNPNTIWLSHHKPFEGNPLNNEESIELWYDLQVVGVPLAMVDRKGFNSSVLTNSNQWEDRVLAQLTAPSYANINIDHVVFNEAARILDFEASAEFGELPTDGGPYRLTAIMVEDSVWGVPQDSYYNNVPGHPLEGLGDKIWAYPHRNVVRNILEDAWGTANVVPDPAEIGVAYQHSYQYQVPEDYRIDRMLIVCVLSRYNESNVFDREVINVQKLSMRNLNDTGNSSNEEIDELSTFHIYPNPSSYYLHIEYVSIPTSISIINVHGKILDTHYPAQNLETLDISQYLPGTYYLRVGTENGSDIKKFTIIR